jgi:hypothetical protein
LVVVVAADLAAVVPAVVLAVRQIQTLGIDAVSEGWGGLSPHRSLGRRSGITRLHEKNRCRYAASEQSGAPGVSRLAAAVLDPGFYGMLK